MDKIGLKNKIKWLKQSNDFYSQFLIKKLEDIYNGR